MISIDDFSKETVVYNYKKQFGTSEIDWPYTIYLGTDVSSGIISDNTVIHFRRFIDGLINLTIYIRHVVFFLLD